MTQLLVKTIADFSTTLTTKTAVGATTGTLNSGLDSGGVQLPTGTYSFTIDRNNSAKEHFTATLTGSALTAIKTVTVGTGVGTSGLLRIHRKGAEVIISDHVAIKRMMNVLDGSTDLDAATPLKYDGATTINNNFHLATKAYVDSVVTGGSLTNTAIVVSATAGATIAAGNLLYFSETDNEWLLTDADTLATVFGVKLGIAMGSGTDGAAITGGVHVYGEYTTSGLIQGDLYYASNTAGAFTNTVGTVPRIIGVAKSTTSLYFDPEFQRVPYAFATDSVGTDAYAVTLAGAFNAYYIGMEVTFKAGTANTGACTLAVNGGAAKTIKKDVSSDLVTGDIILNQIVKVVYDGTNFQFISRQTPLVNNVQVFTANDTWTKPAEAKTVEVICVGAGGGGGGGGTDVPFSTGSNAGSGGGGGSITTKVYRASDLGVTETITIGTGGPGGAGGSGSSDQNGLDGTAGTSSSFGSHLTAYGGGAGFKGSTGGAANSSGGSGAGTGGVGAIGSASSNIGGLPAITAALGGMGGAGGGGDTGQSGKNAECGGGAGGGASSGFSAGGSSLFAAGGGGSGGRNGTGGAGGNYQSYVAGGGGAGGAGGANGTAGTSRSGFGAGSGGGGGGGLEDAGNPSGNGGAGGAPGGGGGGGGANSRTGTATAGTGGVGGRGEVIVISYF